MATVGEKLGFLQRLPMLMKATSDDEIPCPGYLFEEIVKISHESVGTCLCLLEYLLERLQSNSCNVKLKVLKILQYVCGHGSPKFTLELRRNATLIQEVTVFSGPPDLLHGNALYQRVRKTAEELANLLFSDALPFQSSYTSSPSRLGPQTGMGSSPSSGSMMQGFGCTARKESSGSASDAILNKIQKAAEAVVNVVLPPESPRNYGNSCNGEGYQPVLSNSSEAKETKPKNPVSAQSAKLSLRQPGQPGGGWEESDSGHSSQNSSQTNYISDGSSGKAATDSQSGGSRESGDLMESSLQPTVITGVNGAAEVYSSSAEKKNMRNMQSQLAHRVESVNLNDCMQEISLVNNLIQGSNVFLTRDEMQYFIKECALLNCEAVVELLNEKLKDPSDIVNMRSMSILTTLMCSDLLSTDQIFAITHKCLQQLSEGEPGPVTNRATKILRQFQALNGNKSITQVSSSEISQAVSSGKHCHVTVTPLMGLTSGMKEKMMVPPLQFHIDSEKIFPSEKTEVSLLCLPSSSQEAETQENKGSLFPPSECKAQNTNMTQNTSFVVGADNRNPPVNRSTLLPTGKHNFHDEQQTRLTESQSTHSEDTTDNRPSLFTDMVLVTHEAPPRPCLKVCVNQRFSSEMQSVTKQNKIGSKTEVKLLHSNLGQTDSESNQPSAFSFLNTPS